MKRSLVRHTRLIVLILFGLLAALAVWIAARALRVADNYIPVAHASAELLQASYGMPEYSVDAVFDPDARTLRCEQTITWKNNTGEMLDTITLRTYANAFEDADTSPAASIDMYDLCYGAYGFNPGGISVSSVTAAGADASWTYTDDARTVLRININPLVPGGTIDIGMSYTITIPQCAYRFGVSDGIYALGNVFPIAAMYEDGRWRDDSYGSIGDPFFHECANWRVIITPPPGWTCAATGALTGEPYTYQAYAARDFAFTLSNKYATSTVTASGVAVTGYAKSVSQARRLSRAGARAIDIYTKIFGEYPWPVYNIAAVDMPLGGMEYPCLSMIAESSLSNSAELDRAVAHETAHQWFYAQAGSNPINEPWLDESLCSYAVMLYIKDTEGERSAEAYLRDHIQPAFEITIPRGITIGSPLWAFGGVNEYRVIVYERGAGMLWGLGDAAGEEKLRAALRQYIARARFGFAARADFIAALNEETGSDWTGYMVDYLDTFIDGTW